MMNLKVYSLILFFLFAANLPAQESAFKVFYTKGKVLLVKGTDEIDAIKNMLITKDHSVRIEQASMAIFIAPGGEALPVHNAGTYSYNDLQKLQEENSKSLTSRYFTYVIEELTSDHDVGDNQSGGVSRAALLMRMPPDECMLIQKNARFTWTHGISTQPMHLIIRDLNGNTILSKKLEDSAYTHLFVPGKSDIELLWMVGYEEDPSAGAPNSRLTLASKSTRKRINRELQALKNKSKFTDEFNDLLLVNFYDRNKLYYEEAIALEQALLKYPGNELFVKYYERFLKKCGY